MIHIYCYTNITNGKVYIGQAVDISKRAGNNGCKYKGSTNFYSAILTDGWNNFSCATITTVDTNILADYAETRLIAQARLVLGWDNVYNISNGGDCIMRGRKHSPETIKKMSKPKSEEHKANMSKSQTGRKLSDESRLNMSKAKIGKKLKPFSEEHKANMSKSHMGKKRSLESRANQSKALIGNQRNKDKKHTYETKLKISKASKGKPKSEEHKANMSKAKIGKTWKLLDGKRVWLERKENENHTNNPTAAELPRSPQTPSGANAPRS